MPPNGETITDSDSAFFVATSPPQPPSPPPPSNVGGSTSSPGGGSGVPIPSPRLALPASETGSLKEESVTSIDCPAQGFVGEELTCEISIDRILCINCAYSVINPGGIRHSGTTDENGALTLTLGEEGEYIVDAFDSEGNFVSSTAVNAISRPEAPPPSPTAPHFCPGNART